MVRSTRHAGAAEAFRSRTRASTDLGWTITYLASDGAHEMAEPDRDWAVPVNGQPST